MKIPFFFWWKFASHWTVFHRIQSFLLDWNNISFELHIPLTDADKFCKSHKITIYSTSLPPPPHPRHNQRIPCHLCLHSQLWIKLNPEKISSGRFKLGWHNIQWLSLNVKSIEMENFFVIMLCVHFHSCCFSSSTKTAAYISSLYVQSDLVSVLFPIFVIWTFRSNVYSRACRCCM